MKRPLGVTLLAIYCFLGAASSLVFGGAMVWRLWRLGNARYYDEEFRWESILAHPALWVVLIFLLTVFFCRLGWGLWKLENAARLGLIILSIPSLIVGIVDTFVFNSPRPSWDWGSDLALLITDTLLLVYLLLPRVRRAFLPPTDAPPSSL